MLSPTLVEQLFWTSSLNAPIEMCGVLFNDHELYSMQNTATDPTRSFMIDHDEYIQACTRIGKEPWALVHSHPNGTASPSVKDCQLMDALEIAGRDIAMVIVGCKPVAIRIFKKQAHVYRCIWEWKLEPMDPTTIYAAESL